MVLQPFLIASSQQILVTYRESIRRSPSSDCWLGSLNRMSPISILMREVRSDRI